MIREITLPGAVEQSLAAEAAAVGVDLDEYWQRIIDGLASERAAEARRLLFDLSAATAFGKQLAESAATVRLLATGVVTPVNPGGTPDERVQAFRTWVRSHEVRHPAPPPEAYERDSLYEGRP